MNKLRRNHVRRWMPWYEFDRIGGEAHDLSDRSNGLIVLVGFLVAGTAAASVAFPRLTILVSIIGGIVIVAAITAITGQWRALRDGMKAAGGFPPMLELLHVAWQMCLDDVRDVGRGAHHAEFKDDAL